MEVNLGPASVVGEKGLKSQPGGGGGIRRAKFPVS